MANQLPCPQLTYAGPGHLRPPSNLHSRGVDAARNSCGRSEVVLGAVRCVTPGPHPFAAMSGHSPRGVRRAAPNLLALAPFPHSTFVATRPTLAWGWL